MAFLQDWQTYIQGEGIVDGSTGWPSVRRVRHDSSDRLVVLSEDGGARSEIGTSSGVGSAAMEDPGMQVMVRGGPHESDAAQAKAQEIRDALHGLRGVTVGGVRYLRVMSVTPRPIFAGVDDNERSMHTIAFRMLRLAEAST